MAEEAMLDLVPLACAWNAKDAERVRIAGKGFMVVQLPGRLSFMSAPLEDEEVEEDESGEDSE
jgi:hypothetical protein